MAEPSVFCEHLTPYESESVAAYMAQVFHDAIWDRPVMIHFKCAEADHWHACRASFNVLCRGVGHG
jgi:hypothetical protein